MKIGSIIKEKRTKLGLTQDDLAKKLQVSRSTISNWEINRNYPDIKLIVNISNILDIPLNELLQEDSDIVNRLSEDTIIRKKISKRNKILYFLIFILIISLLSVAIYFSNINDISNKKEIVGAYISNEKLYIKTDLPIYKSIGGYFVDINNNTIEVSIFTKLSFKHNEKISIPISKENLKGINRVRFIYNGHNYKTISLE
ncbi:helix-turn-helix transcriptional regulator [Mogibacterium neglectum]|uniref:helix-turn-helix domain-containing protein n=1 Tax=Mogibacterium neglectum TaxID=114528 RepID=UPI00272A6DC8|nr:helix-turn-helix transcriptional regulator [Mogibacterium neglectum]WLD76241.1 helix-turn-helix transcriptional regulator [Mogibacterium neglectum]